MAPPLSVPGPYKSHMQLTLQLLELEPNLLKVKLANVYKCTQYMSTCSQFFSFLLFYKF